MSRIFGEGKKSVFLKIVKSESVIRAYSSVFCKPRCSRVPAIVSGNYATFLAHSICLSDRDILNRALTTDITEILLICDHDIKRIYIRSIGLQSGSVFLILFEIIHFRFMKDEPENIETSLKKCKKLTGTLFTLKR